MDGFQLASGLVALIAAPMLLATGTSPAQCLLLFGSGIVIVAAQWVIAFDAELQPLDRAHTVLAVFGVACLLLAMTYLTRSADDLPRLLPGHDADSHSLQFVPGVVSLLVATVALARTAAIVRPRHGSGAIPGR